MTAHRHRWSRWERVSLFLERRWCLADDCGQVTYR